MPILPSKTISKVKAGSLRNSKATDIGENEANVYEASVADLTQEELTMLVHFGKDKTQQWQLVRLEEPEGDS